MPRTPKMLRPWQRWLSAPSTPTERIGVRTPDGLGLVIHRVRHAGRKPGPAVMMVHGLGANRHAFHFPGRSLAEYLAEHGFDCFIPELRGHGLSERRGFAWDMDDYLEGDLPIIIDTIREKSGQEKVHWIGHSMGGILLFCYGILHSDAPILSGTAVGAALDYTRGKSWFSPMLRLEPVLKRIPAVPFGTFTHLVAPLTGRYPDPLTKLNFWPSNIEPEMVRRAYATVFHTIPVPLLESLAGALGPRGLVNRDRSISFLERAGSYQIPTRLLAGSKDMQAPARTVQHTASLFGGPTEVRVFGREHGEMDEYGHWDLLIGRLAFEEVWPDILSWLESRVIGT
ncbi:alpha/beta fold hydrolase [Myxococcota bacterium]